MSETYNDAVCFKPKMDIHFLGFGLMNHYEKKDFKFKFKYNVNDVDSSEIEVDVTQDMVTQPSGLIEIDFQKLNINPVQVKAG